MSSIAKRPNGRYRARYRKPDGKEVATASLDSLVRIWTAATGELESAPNSHSAIPKNQVAPRMPNTGYIQKMRGPLLIYGISTCASYSNHF